MKLAYIAGPMSGYPLYNFPAFDEARDSLTKLGYSVVSPADLDRKAGFDPHISIVDKKFLDEAMTRDLIAIQCADCLVMLPGWQQSTGALAEFHLARWRHIPIYQYPSMEEITRPCKQVVTPPAQKDPKAEAGSKKCPLHLLPPHPLRETAWVHALGAKKYGAFNWLESGVSLGTYIGAIMRHLLAMADGEWLDPESQHPHAAHIAASCNILMDAENANKLDR